MFPDLEIASKFACGRTMTTAIAKKALSPYYHAKAIHNMSNPFSVLMDESNNKQNISYIMFVSCNWCGLVSLNYILKSWQL